MSDAEYRYTRLKRRRTIPVRVLGITPVIQGSCTKKLLPLLLGGEEASAAGVRGIRLQPVDLETEMSHGHTAIPAGEASIIPTRCR